MRILKLAVMMAALLTASLPGHGAAASVMTAEVTITSIGKDYPAHIAAPKTAGRKPAIVYIHSIRGYEPGYETMVGRLAGEGFVVLALKWQTFERTPPDATTEQLLRDAIAFLRLRSDVDGAKLGITGFCIGGRYTMLFLPLVSDFKAGVAWYGFPYAGGTEIQPKRPADVLAQLKAPLLILHGSADAAAKIADIYKYAQELDAAGKYYELKVYQGEPHSFALKDGQFSDSVAAQDAYREMVAFFTRNLK